MENSTQVQIAPPEKNHKRTKSSVLKSIVAPLNHKRTLSTGQTLSSPTTSENPRPRTEDSERALPILPPHYSHKIQPLAESNNNGDRHKTFQENSIAVSDTPDIHRKPKKSKSSTNLSAFLSRPRSSKSPKKEEVRLARDKENQTPPGSSYTPPTPIWAQFASQTAQDVGPLTEYSTVERWSIDDGVVLYTPKENSPSQQRDSQDSCQTRRPKSAFVPTGPTVASFTETVSKLQKTNGQRLDNLTSPHRPGEQQVDTNTEETAKRRSNDVASTRRRGAKEGEEESSQLESNKTKSGSRVMAAVVAWNGKAKESILEEKDVKLDSQAIESAFEILLDSRNVPHNMRDKMRSLDKNIKADFIKQDRSGSASSTDNLASQAISKKVPSRPGTGQRSKTDTVSSPNEDHIEKIEDASPKKKSRPRSLTFTMSKGDSSPTKKQKSEGNLSHGRKKSGDLRHSSSSKSLASAGAAQIFAPMNKVPKPAIPEDFISYLQKVQKPELVEVGRLHKLRQLLRNETVSWVDSFITKGGMTEIVALLHRIIGIEWREEHEDSLLHETLLCLKALCTTSLALARLSAVQDTLFPTLLNLLFNDDKKGPSEFTTRNIIISLLFTYLSASPSPSRASEILAYLHDPSPPEEAQPPGFITSIYISRPYRVWCKEIVNVTKEVFWIFLHHLNIVPYPSSVSPSADTSSPLSYQTLHFPPPRPPVPAAPYVGGVEWEATNYIAAHLDLLNGLMACLPTSRERNALRQELRDSGFEKIMGATLRTCKEKFYGGVHSGLTTWVGAGRDDGWEVRGVREGPRRRGDEDRDGHGHGGSGGGGSPRKRKGGGPPMLELVGLELGGNGGDGGGGNWL